MNTLIQTMREKYIEKGWRLHTIHFDTSVGFGNCSNKDNKNNGNNHVVLLVFRFFLCVWPLFLPGSLSLFIQTAAKQLSVLSTKHRKTIIPVVFWQFQLKTISLGVTRYQFSMLLLLIKLHSWFWDTFQANLQSCTKSKKIC